MHLSHGKFAKLISTLIPGQIDKIYVEQNDDTFHSDFIAEEVPTGRSNIIFAIAHMSHTRKGCCIIRKSGDYMLLFLTLLTPRI